MVRNPFVELPALPPAQRDAYAQKLDELVKVVLAGLPDANPSRKSRRVFRRKRQELIEMLRKAVTDSFFRDVHKQISDMSPEQMERLKERLEELEKEHRETLDKLLEKLEIRKERSGKPEKPAPSESQEGQTI